MYAHFPWCVRKCPYCDFNSHRAPRVLPERAYVDALLRDLDFELAQRPWPPIASMFLGGGTPSLFGATEIARFLEGVAARLELTGDCEITLEANPGTVEAGRFRDYRQAGVNRLSLGVQSFDDQRLRALGRIHDGDQARAAARAARTAGFLDLNLDLMYGLPGQDEDTALSDLRAALELEPTHLSLYQLTLEENTPVYRNPPPLPDEDRCWRIGEVLGETAAKSGFARYEISAWALPLRRARHNLNYWNFGDYLGIGAGAHGKRTCDSGIQRRARVRNPTQFLETAGTSQALSETRRVPAGELPLEFLMNRLRLPEPLSWAQFRSGTGLPPEALEPGLSRARTRGLAETDDTGFRLTPRGQRFLNEVLLLF
ncbi:MAG: radical SAM family heme chaperone HemW [Gammaproteobacteria bacterium]|nr:radical SAM family heme chaperone HemW [Gammaproteobacteria bacterium]